MFDNDYIDIDELGIREIRCMATNAVIARRTYKTIKIPAAPRPRIEKVLAMEKLTNFSQLRIALEDGSFADIFVCKAYKQKVDDGQSKIDFEKDEDLTGKIAIQLGNAEALDLASKGRSKLEQDQAKSDWLTKKRVVRTIRQGASLQDAHADAIAEAKEFREKKKKGGR